MKLKKLLFFASGRAVAVGRSAGSDAVGRTVGRAMGSQIDGFPFNVNGLVGAAAAALRLSRWHRRPQLSNFCVKACYKLECFFPSPRPTRPLRLSVRNRNAAWNTGAARADGRGGVA